MNSIIVDIAKSFLGQTETPNNSGFKDKNFETAMKSVGWVKGYSWCVLFVKLVWKNAIADETTRAAAMKLINPNSQATLQNFIKDKSGLFEISDKATPGAIAIFQTFKNGKGQWTGHAGLVTAAYPDYFESIEGNTNDAGGREGYIVATKKRKYNSAVTNGLRLRKFISIKNQ